MAASEKIHTVVVHGRNEVAFAIERNPVVADLFESFGFHKQAEAMRAPPPPEVQEWDGKLVCPHCGNDNQSSFWYLDDVTIYRRISASGSRGYPFVATGSDESQSDGDNDRLLCDACGEEFGIPKGLEFEFDYR